MEAYEQITYDWNGQYSIVIQRLADGETLFSYSNDDLDLWRDGTTVVRPKWGIYRSLNHPEHLRDEQVLFDRFCLAKGADDCVSDRTLPDFAIRAMPRRPVVVAGGIASYSVLLIPRRDFVSEVSLSVAGLPPDATAIFTPGVAAGWWGSSSLRVTTSATTSPGRYTLIVSGISGVLSHASLIPLVVRSP